MKLFAVHLCVGVARHVSGADLSALLGSQPSLLDWNGDVDNINNFISLLIAVIFGLG